MHVSGAVVRIDAGADETAVIRRIQRCDGVTIGERHDRALPVVIEARDARHAVDLVHSLEHIGGVRAVDIVFVEVQEQCDEND